MEPTNAEMTSDIALMYIREVLDKAISQGLFTRMDQAQTVIMAYNKIATQLITPAAVPDKEE